MSVVLSAENQQQVEDLLLERGVIKDAKVTEYRKKAKAGKESLFSYLIKNKILDDEELTKAIADVTGLPYVNLSKSDINPQAMQLIPKDMAQRFMAVPLGEMQNRLVVAMLDASNVQAVDFLSNKLNRPLKVYMASESGIKKVLSEYHTDLARGLKGLAELGAQQQADSGKKGDKKKSEHGQDIKTIVQDSPI